MTIIGPSGNGKSTLADVFGFIADCLEMGVEAACDAGNRGGYEKLISQGAKDPISFEIYYRETYNSKPITYQLDIDVDNWIFLCGRKLHFRKSGDTKIATPTGQAV